MFSVEGRDDWMSAQLCSLASSVRDALGTCGLVQSRPVAIEVVDDLRHPMGDCLASYDCDEEVIRLTSPDSFRGALDPDALYARLPEDVLTKALLTHEMAHAFATQAAGERRIDIVDQEYIAAAMELHLMEPRYRAVILDAAPVDAPPSETLIDIWIYGFSPRRFAVNAWRHFQEPENGCALVRRIVAGEASFAKAARPELR